MKKLTAITKAIALARASSPAEMTRIAITTTAILVATGSAFAGSDNYDSNVSNQPVATSADVDNTFTASIGELFTSEQSAVSTTVQTQSTAPESGRGIWGR
ncbi:DUF680 domain-containing protein [Mesorhizobium cantuariense]|uniref:DUF680 domain-containing protein n=1 Tax=Mesorhizobium cantuariense TaxID=1300275 RepID=A0ABV7MLI2_9HYPH